MKIVIGSDHAGFELKREIVTYIANVKQIACVDMGPFNTNSVDYPDYAAKVCERMLDDPDLRGILLCGTGIGMSMKANRYPRIFATLCNSAEDAKLAKQHNNSNVLVLGARKLTFGAAREIIDTWLETEFEGGRHQVRIYKIDKIDV